MIGRTLPTTSTLRYSSSSLSSSLPLSSLASWKDRRYRQCGVFQSQSHSETPSPSMISQIRRIATNQLSTRTKTSASTGIPHYQYHHHHRRSFWTLSFSAAGHLLPYHLGVAKTLLRNEDEDEDDDDDPQSHSHSHLFKVPIHSVVGSSSGAIAATVTTVLSHRLEEYTDHFLQDRGYALRNLRDMLSTDTTIMKPEQQEKKKEKTSLQTPLSPPVVLSICTTRCSDGGIELFSFNTTNSDNINNNNNNHDPNQKHKHDRLLTAIEASCRIPRSFHPFDLFTFMGNNQYPDAEGIEIEREMEMENDGSNSNNNNRRTGYYVDGGIAAPFPSPPPIPLLFLDSQLQHSTCMGTIVVSPIAGDYYYDCYDSHSDTTRTGNSLRRAAAPPPALHAIRPRDDSWKIPALLPLSSFQLAGCGPRSTYSSSTSDNSNYTNDSIGNNNYSNTNTTTIELLFVHDFRCRMYGP